jgi:hypothetical protein
MRRSGQGLVVINEQHRGLDLAIRSKPAHQKHASAGAALASFTLSFFA